MRTFQGLFFLISGLGLLIMDYRSLAKGWLPFGSNWLKGRLEFRRADQPGLYWMAFILYLIFGLVLTVYAIRLFAGLAAPLPLR